jgi:hypothetical protein
MKMNALIGFSGFVGSHLIDRIGDADYYNSKNIETIKGKAYDTVYCAGLYAEKWRINKNPEADLESICSLQKLLSTVSCRQFILISTIDVLDPSIPQSETPDEGGPVLYSTHSYGRNRRQMEEWVLMNFPNTYILRLPALFGHGLKKNALYDLIHSNNIDALRSHWQFQWYDVNWLIEDIERIQNGSHSIVNCVTPTISLDQITSMFFPNIRLSDKQDICVRYAFSSDSYIHRKQSDVIAAMSRYIKSSSIQPFVSELAWTSDQDLLMKSFLTANGIGLECVPTKHSWNLSGYSTIYSVQSILFGEVIQIFSEQQRFLKILTSIVEALATKNTKVIVFGSPKQRVYCGEDITNLFKSIGDLCARYDIQFCIENNSAEYGCNWMTKYRDTIEFVKKINHPNIRMNLDTGSCFMENEEIDIKHDDIDYIGHVQISFPFLNTWDSMYLPSLSNMVQNLHSLNYKKAISLEMKSMPTLPFKAITEFLKVVRQDTSLSQISQ